MTTRTTIPTDRHGNTGDPDGPIDCARCSLSLVDRHPDSLSIDSATWEHDTGDGDLAICDDCQSEADQQYAWMQIVRWQERSPGTRALHIGRDGLTITGEHGTAAFVRSANGKLDTAGAMTVVMRESAERMQPRFDLLAGAVDECPATERNVGDGA